MGSTCDLPGVPWLGCDRLRTWAPSAQDYRPYYADTNALSLVTEIRVGGIGVVIGGDMPARGRRILLRDSAFRAALAGIHSFIASHHGRADGCCEEMFGTGWHPRIVIMSDKRQGHDTQATGQFYRRRSLGVAFDDGETRHVLGTHRYGTISVEFPRYGRCTIRTDPGRVLPTLTPTVPEFSRQLIDLMLGDRLVTHLRDSISFSRHASEIRDQLRFWLERDRHSAIQHPRATRA